MRQYLAADVPDDRLRTCTSEEDLPALLTEVDVMVAGRFRGRRFPHEQILRGPRLRWLHLGSAGVDYMLPLPTAGPVVTSSALLSARTW